MGDQAAYVILPGIVPGRGRKRGDRTEHLVLNPKQSCSKQRAACGADGGDTVAQGTVERAGTDA